MPKNSLYNVINKVTLNEEKIPGVVDLSLRTYQEGKNYFFFELPVPDDIVIGDYTLLDHHLSVSESPLSKLDMKSQYHYTAYFKDIHGNRYRLHVYYDAHDNYVCEPLLSIVREGNVFKSVDCQEQHEAFKRLAERFIGGVVEHLRDNQRAVITDYQKQYEELEKMACSLDCVKNKGAYLATMQEQINVLDELKHYSNDNRAWNNLLSFHRRVKNTLLTAVAPDVSEKTVPQAPVSKKTTKLRKQEPSLKQKAAATSYPSKPKAVKPRLDAVIASLKARFEQLNSMQDEQQVSAITAFFGELIVEECVLEHGKYQSTAQDVRELHLLRVSSEEQAKKLLLRLLLAGCYEQAAQLKAFHHTLSDSLMPYALVHNKPGLIDFLLKHKVVLFNYKNFVIKEAKYKSLLDFYFKQEVEKQSSLIDGIDVLIKNAPSLLMDIDSNTGLPFAAIILLDPEHPFNAVLERNADATINNPLFYKQLNQVLQALVAQPSYPREHMVQIKKLVNRNNEKMSSVALFTPSGQPSLMQLTEDLTVKLKATLGEDFVDQLLCDPEIAPLKSLIEKRKALLMLKLPRSVQTGIRQEAKENFEAIIKELDDAENIDLLPAIAEQIRSRTLQHQLDTLNAIDLREELIDVQDSIQKTVLITGKRNKNYNALLKRQDEIITELKAYNKRAADKSIFSSALLDAALTSKLEELREAFDSLTKLLQGLNNLLAPKREKEADMESDAGSENGVEPSGKEKEKIFSYSDQNTVKTLFSAANTSTSIDNDTLCEEQEYQIQYHLGH